MKMFINLNLPTLLVMVRERETSQKTFDFLAFNLNLNHSNMRSTRDAMNFQKGELLSGSPGTIIVIEYKGKKSLITTYGKSN